MASLGNALVNKILGHSEAEKAFRPWWDNLEDFLVYGLVMLGLIVAPTAIINGTPLDCNFCTEDGCKDYFERTNTSHRDAEPPDYNFWWVKKYCTMTAVDGFILYFPYILLIMALMIVLIERVFIRIFQAGLKLEAFYSLIQKDIEETQEDFSSTNQDVEESINNKTAIEVLHSFSSSSNFFVCYLVRTVIETVVASLLLAWLIFMGFPSMQRDEFIHCNVHGYHYECAGHPQEFYVYVLLVTVAILVVYLFCCLYNFVWLLMPQLGSLSRVMSKYRTMLRKRYDGNEDTTILGELHWIYFNNRDLKLLLDLLATSSGVSQSISLLTLFDQSLRQKCVASHLKIHRDGSRATVEVHEAEAIRDLFSKMKDLSCIYTVQIHPPTINSSVQALKFSSNKSFKEYATDIEMQPLDHSREVRTATFTDLNEGQEYIFRVSTLVNGHPIAKKILQ
uniref:Uncharacterized protein n=1 Tax=Lepeophtheirus salmonis TaxID=72036 RepID=A0A0K2U8T8_LEPSM